MDKRVDLVLTNNRLKGLSGRCVSLVLISDEITYTKSSFIQKGLSA